MIAGYTIVNDVTVRDWQFKAPTMTIGKSFDTHGPTGPWVVTADEIPDPQDLRIRTWVNEQLLQDASTKEMIFDCAQQIETLSTAFTLEPGDLIATGTPAGVGIVRQPPVFLRPGDSVRIEIDGIGTLENPVIAEPDDTAFIENPTGGSELIMGMHRLTQITIGVPDVGAVAGFYREFGLRGDDAAGRSPHATAASSSASSRRPIAGSSSSASASRTRTISTASQHRPARARCGLEQRRRRRCTRSSRSPPLGSS